MVSISKSSITEDVWKIFYDRMINQVTSVTLVNNDTYTVQNYVSAYSDKMLSVKSNYPILIIESPSFSTDYYTASKDKFDGTINIEIYTNQSETADKLFSKIIEAVETYKPTLRASGVYRTKLTDTDTDMVERSGLKIHMRRATFSFEYNYIKT